MGGLAGYGTVHDHPDLQRRERPDGDDRHPPTDVPAPRLCCLNAHFAALVMGGVLDDEGVPLPPNRKIAKTRELPRMIPAKAITR